MYRNTLTVCYQITELLSSRKTFINTLKRFFFSLINPRLNNFHRVQFLIFLRQISKDITLAESLSYSKQCYLIIFDVFDHTRRIDVFDHIIMGRRSYYYG